MRRYRTRTTAWPAVADLMTALAVVGLACAVLVASRDPSGEVDILRETIDSLEVVIDTKELEIVRLGAKIDTLSTIAAGFTPCWRRNDLGGYYFTYDITVQDGQFSFAVHEDWAADIEFRSTIPPSLVQELDDYPRGDVAEEQVVSFGERAHREVREVAQDADYPADCELAVTINDNAILTEVRILRRAGYYPVVR